MGTVRLTHEYTVLPSRVTTKLTKGNKKKNKKSKKNKKNKKDSIAKSRTLLKKILNSYLVDLFSFFFIFMNTCNSLFLFFYFYF